MEEDSTLGCEHRMQYVDDYIIVYLNLMLLNNATPINLIYEKFIELLLFSRHCSRQRDTKTQTETGTNLSPH